MKARQLGICLSALIAAWGCQGSWNEGKVAQLRSDKGSHAKPDIEQAEPEPDPKILPETFHQAGMLAEARGDLSAAVALYRKSVALSHDYVEGHSSLGLILNRAGQYKEAQASLQKAVELAPDKAYLRNNLAFCYIYQERWTDAEIELRRALELRKDFTRARINLAMVLAQMGRYGESLDQFLVVLPPTSAHYNLGLLHESARRYDLARESFVKALNLDPKFTSAVEGLRRVARTTGVSADDSRTASSGTGVRANQSVSLRELTEAEPASAVVEPTRDGSPATDDRPAGLQDEPCGPPTPASLLRPMSRTTDRVRPLQAVSQGWVPSRKGAEEAPPIVRPNPMGRIPTLSRSDEESSVR